MERSNLVTEADHSSTTYASAASGMRVDTDKKF